MPDQPDKYQQVKGVIKSLGLDQADLADKLGVKQASISQALNGGNNKAFQRIVQILETEYSITSLNQHLESAVGNELAVIKNMLQNLQNSVDELRQEIRDLKKE